MLRLIFGIFTQIPTMKYTKILFVFSFLLSQASAQDSLVIRRIYDEALLRGQAYENLRRRQWQRERGDISHTERRACLDC